MNCTNLQAFMRLIVDANVIVLKKKNFCEIVSFNNCSDKEDFRNQLFFYKKETQIDQLVVEETQEKYSTVDHSIKANLLLGNFYTHTSNLLLNCNLTVRTVSGELLIIEHLHDALIKEISEYIELQLLFANKYISLHKYCSPEIKHIPQKNKSSLKFTGHKTYVIEFVNSLYESGKFEKEGGGLTKKEFFEIFGHFLNVNLDGWESTLNKIINRDNPTRFLNLLKGKMEDYIRKNLT